jgi:hypothetical protein
VQQVFGTLLVLSGFELLASGDAFPASGMKKLVGTSKGSEIDWSQDTSSKLMTGKENYREKPFQQTSKAEYYSLIGLILEMMGLLANLCAICGAIKFFCAKRVAASSLGMLCSSSCILGIGCVVVSGV